MELKYTSIVLVGLCNEEPHLQELIGTIRLRKNGDLLEPRMIYVQQGQELGTMENPHIPTIEPKQKGRHTLTFPTYAGGHGVSVSLDKEKGIYSFTTGLNRGDMGASGPISHGGPELAEILDQLYKAELTAQ